MTQLVIFQSLEVGDTFLDPNTDEPYIKRSTSVAKCLDAPGLEVVFNDADEVYPTDDPGELYK